MSLRLGDQAPELELPDTGGQAHRIGGGGAVSVVVWTCNHCPYAVAWHERLVAVARDYAERGVRTFMVNSNDAGRYPQDSLQAMRERVEAEEWPCPYLHDSSQEAAASWGPKVTPDVFVLDAEGRLRYRGAPDPDYRDGARNAEWLRGALDRLLAGEEVERPETDPVGCSIKWRD